MARMMDRDAREVGLWVRRCRRCGERDLRSAVGAEVVIDDRPWSCPACGSRTWASARIAFPIDPSARCPHLGSDVLGAEP